MSNFKKKRKKKERKKKSPCEKSNRCKIESHKYLYGVALYVRSSQQKTKDVNVTCMQLEYQYKSQEKRMIVLMQVLPLSTFVTFAFQSNRYYEEHL